MPPIFLFLISAVILLGAIYLVWRYWNNTVNLSPDEEAFDERIAALNERQANRLSDDQLIQPLSGDDAWKIMVNRGRQVGRRQERYGGNLSRRAKDRRR